MTTGNSNLAKGQNSYDSESSGMLIEFFNRNVTPYPTEAGGIKFDLVPVKEQKDQMLNIARMHAQQEYDRIMDLVKVLERQAQQIKRRLEITDQVHSAEYKFQLYHGQNYWLIYNTRLNKTILSTQSPGDWFTGVPEDYQYVARVKWLGDHSWIEVNDDGMPIG